MAFNQNTMKALPQLHKEVSFPDYPRMFVRSNCTTPPEQFWQSTHNSESVMGGVWSVHGEAKQGMIQFMGGGGLNKGWWNIDSALGIYSQVTVYNDWTQKSGYSNTESFYA